MLVMSPASLARLGLVLAAPVALINPVSSPAVWATGRAVEFKDSPKVVLDEAWQIIHREYVDSGFNQVDWQQTRQQLLGREYSSQEAAYGALRSALRQLNDPYTRFLSPAEYSDLTDQTSGEVSGIGVRLQYDDQVREVVVSEVMAGSAAAQAGIAKGDRIMLIDGQSTERLTVDAISQRLRGAIGSQVTLTISRAGGSSRSLILTRGREEVPTVEYALKQSGNRAIGYIRLIEFNAQAPEQMAAAIRSLTSQGVEGFVLDLRGNPGGLLMASIDIGRMWLQHGPIVRTQDRNGTDEAISANRTALTQLPLTVLVDRRSASSSEILTGALRDNKRAVVVGTPTFGKALVQSLHGLADGSGLTVTVAHYYTPNGTDISRRGITPDVSVEISDRQRSELFTNPSRLATTADTQYLRALQVLEQTITTQNVNRPTTQQLGLVEETTP
jgi:carboxyl-terminal processing protease